MLLFFFFNILCSGLEVAVIGEKREREREGEQGQEGVRASQGKYQYSGCDSECDSNCKNNSSRSDSSSNSSNNCCHNNFN